MRINCRRKVEAAATVCSRVRAREPRQLTQRGARAVGTAISGRVVLAAASVHSLHYQPTARTFHPSSGSHQIIVERRRRAKAVTSRSPRQREAGARAGDALHKQEERAQCRLIDAALAARRLAMRARALWAQVCVPVHSARALVYMLSRRQRTHSCSRSPICRPRLTSLHTLAGPRGGGGRICC